MKNRNLAIIITIILCALAVFVIGKVANAHHPLVSGVAECDDDTLGLYQVRWTVRPDAPRPGLDWTIGGAGTIPADQPFEFVERGLSQESITKTITATWFNRQGEQVAGPSTRTSAPVTKPTGCTPETTTTTVPETTTTVPETTTTVDPPPTTEPPTETSTTWPETTTSNPESPTTTSTSTTPTPSETSTSSSTVPGSSPVTTQGTAPESSTTPSSNGDLPQLPETGNEVVWIALVGGWALLVGLILKFLSLTRSDDE